MQPYDPQRPATPESFAGRRELVTFVERAIETGTTLHRGTAILLHGYRGAGKTSALRKIESIVRSSAPRSIVIEVPLRAPSSELVLIQSFAELIQQQVDLEASIPQRVKRALSLVKSVSVLGTGVERSSGPRPVHSTPIAVWKDVLAALRGISVLCVCLDDAELLKVGEVGILKTIVETDSPMPVLIAVAGGPDLLEKLSARDTSPILRAFSGAIFDIGQFSLEETREALLAPLASIVKPSEWDATAIQEIHHLTHGYPYLVLCFAAATYRERTVLTAKDVKFSIPASLKLAASWLDREMPQASDEDIRAFARIATLGKSQLRSSEMLRVGVNPIYVSRLVSLGVLKRVSRGAYELRKAPAVAFFHILKRGLDTV
jgi:hypothetical protein